MTICPAIPVTSGVPTSPTSTGGTNEADIDLAEEIADRELVKQATAGDLTAYDELVRRYQDRVYGLIYHMTSHHEDASDLAQEAFVKAWKALKNFKGDSSFYTWIYRIAVNHTLNHLKQRRQRTPHLSLNDLDLNPEHSKELLELISHHNPRREVNLREISESLNIALQRLSEEHRAVVVLHDIQGLPHDEIGRLLKCNPGTVRSRLYYARQQLQAWLSDYWK
jgi:RNA polymerase sigma-70 factor (ECF subfamily)